MIKILLAVFTALQTVLSLRGGNRHLYYLISEAHGKGYLPLSRIMHLADPFSFMALAAGRISVALLILRIIKTSVWRSRFLYAMIVVTLFATTVWCVLWLAKCPPSSGITPPYQAGVCWNPPVMLSISILTAGQLLCCDVVLSLIMWHILLSMECVCRFCPRNSTNKHILEAAYELEEKN